MMRWLRRLQPVFLVIALLFLAGLVYSQWDELTSQTWELSPAWLALSAGFLALAWMIEIRLWLRILQVMDATLPLWSATRVWFLSAIVRYIPGNIWQPLSLTVLSEERGVPVAVTLTSLLLYQVIIILAVAPLAAVYFAITGNWGLLTGFLRGVAPWLIVAGMMPLVLFLVRPAWLIDLVNWGLTKLGRSALATHLSRMNLLELLGIAIVDWLVWGCSFAALSFGVQSYSTAEIMRLAPHLIAAYPIAYAIGFVSLITPSGIGVREGAFYLLLAPIAGGGPATVMALAMRLWTTLGEVVAATLALIFRDHPAAKVAPPGTTDGEMHEGLA